MTLLISLNMVSMEGALSTKLRGVVVIWRLYWCSLAESDMAICDGRHYVLHTPNYLLLGDIEVTQKILCH